MSKFINKIIMLSIKNKLLRPIQFIFKKLGFRVHLTLISNSKDIHFFDKNIWIPFADKENYYTNLYNDALKKTGKEWSNNFSKELRFYSLFYLVKSIIKKNNKINFAECGCWYGHSSYAISKILLENNFSGKFEIYDSFEEGLSDFGSKDKNYNNLLNDDEKEIQRKAFSSNENFVRKLLKEFNFVNIYKGWIPEVFNKQNKNKYQFVHIDVDLYDPTYKSLDFFYPRLVEKGIIVIDDYNLSQFTGAKTAVDDFLKKNEVSFFYEIPFGGCFLIK